MKYMFFVVILLSLFSCKIKKDDVEYRLERNKNEKFDIIKVIDKNNIEIFNLRFNNNGALDQCTININENIYSKIYLIENNINSYYISDGKNYSNITNLYDLPNVPYSQDEHGDIILYRCEDINGNTYLEKIYKDDIAIEGENRIRKIDISHVEPLSLP
jgi:hypothetical protein